MMGLAEDLKRNQVSLVDQMVPYMVVGSPSSESELRQFIGGFVHLMAEAAGGNLLPREDYLNTVIPAIKKAGMTLTVTMKGMVDVSMLCAAFLDRAHLTWVRQFCLAYTEELLRVWDNS